jgi:hypothetical protein
VNIAGLDNDVEPGIGNRTILEANNIPVVLELPAVGENLQVG